MKSEVAKHRRIALAHARALARSGQHENFRSILASLQCDELARAQNCFEDARFRVQLNTLCDRARSALTLNV